MPRKSVAVKKEVQKTTPASTARASAARVSATPPAVTEEQAAANALALFHPVTREWFRAVFETVTAPQREGWPAISRGESTLILAPTGTGKTLFFGAWTRSCCERLRV